VLDADADRADLELRLISPSLEDHASSERTACVAASAIADVCRQQLTH
jgi:hypothetical protein